MGDLQRVLYDLLQLVIRLGTPLVRMISGIVLYLQGNLRAAGLSDTVQVVVLAGTTLAIIFLSVRVLGGLLRFAVVLVLLLIALNVFMPDRLLPSF